MRMSLPRGAGWTLADLVDFEMRLAAGDADAHERAVFARDIRPALPAGDAASRRRAGLRAWLDHRRARDHRPDEAGALFTQGLRLARLALFALMVFAGGALALGLCSGPARVHVVLFVGVTLVVPWLVYLGGRLARIAGPRYGGLAAGVLARLLQRVARARGIGAPGGLDRLRRSLTDSSGARRVLAAEIDGLLQIGGIGFNLGLIGVFVAALMVFDMHFYWEATPQTAPAVHAGAKLIAAPWAWVWPAAVPDAKAVASSRARTVDGSRVIATGARANGRWWRFLLMALAVWGLLARVLLWLISRWRLRAALAGLDFQAPRHRALWRSLTAVQRGAVAAPAADGALVLDVGGHGVRGTDLRGYLLRGLRVNPQQEARIGVLDEADERAADAALAASPAHVVLLVEDWHYSPRAVASLQARVRAATGSDTPVTWLVFGLADGVAVAPDAAHLARWTRFVDGLREPGTEVAGYAPGL